MQDMSLLLGVLQVFVPIAIYFYSESKRSKD